jgi:hypothetical protein
LENFIDDGGGDVGIVLVHFIKLWGMV